MALSIFQRSVTANDTDGVTKNKFEFYFECCFGEMYKNISITKHYPHSYLSKLLKNNYYRYNFNNNV